MHCIILVYYALFKYTVLTFKALDSKSLPALAMNRKFESLANSVIAIFSTGRPECGLSVLIKRVCM